MKAFQLLLATVVAIAFIVVCAPCYGFDIVQITDTANLDEEYYATAVYDTTVYVVWREPGTGNLYFDKSTDSGRTWGAHRKVVASSQSYQSYNFLLVDGSGNLYLMYGDGWDLKLLRSVDGGEVFFEAGSFRLNGLNWTTKAGCLDVTVSENGRLYSAQIIDNGHLILRTWDNANTGFTVIDPDIWLDHTSEIKVETSASGEDLYFFYVEQLVFLIKFSNYGATQDYIEAVWHGGIFEEHYAYGYGYGIDTALTNLADGQTRIDVVWNLWIDDLEDDPLLNSESYDGGQTFTHKRVCDVGSFVYYPSVAVDNLGAAYSSFFENTLDNNGSPIRRDLFFDAKSGKASKFREDLFIAGPLERPENTDISKSVTGVPSDGLYTYIMHSNSPFEGGSRDLYCARIVNVKLNDIGDKQIGAGWGLNFQISAKQEGEDIAYSVYLAGDVDPNHDGVRSPLDILNFVNTFNTYGNPIALGEPGWNPEMDLDNNDYITPMDLLMVINWINAYGVMGMPSGITINNTTGDFSWTPTEGQVGTHYLTFVASHEDSKDAETVKITVNHIPASSPVLNSIGDQAGTEGELFLIRPITATDVNPDTLTLSSPNLPNGAAIYSVSSSPGEGAWALRWPSPAAGTYEAVEFIVDDGNGGTASEKIDITIPDMGNRPPILNSIGDQSGTEGELFLIRPITATDVNSDTLTLSSPNLPNGAAIYSVSSTPGEGAWALRWHSPAAGTYEDVEFIVDDGNGGTASEKIDITIADIGNRPPVLNSIGDQSGTEGALFLIRPITATDVNPDTLSLSSPNLPNGAAIYSVSSTPGEGAWALRWHSPAAGTYEDVEFIVDDGNGGTASEKIDITINP